jgi:ATP-dependent helicase HrpB
MPSYRLRGLDEDLPVCSLETPFRRALRRGPVVLTSPTGSGKSTWAPLWAADLWPEERVLVVEPRRVACRSLARFVARRCGVELGREVGYAVRHDDRVASGTRVAFVTPGVALRLLHAGVSRETTVLLDEFHQRGLETDLLLALLLERGQRRLGILSATLDGERVARHVDGELLTAEGRLFQVEIRHLGPDPVPGGHQLAERVAQALVKLRDGEGDVLVFLPGKGEINDCLARLEGDPLFDVLPLHAELPPAKQDQAFEPSDRRRVILSTNVAETSVTLPWVRSVIDSGLVRRTVYREGRGALTLTPVACDAADQRAGRAGRLAPGVCLRLWSVSAKLEQRTPPEILREDLSQLVLQVARFGRQMERLPWLDPPRSFAVDEARSLLTALGLLEVAGPFSLTEAGRQVGRLPLDPVLGRLLLAGQACGAARDMVPLVAALSLGRPLFIRGEPSPPDELEPDPLTNARCDATALILALRRPELARRRVRREAYEEARRVAGQLARLLGVELAPSPDRPIQRLPLEEAVFRAVPDAAFARRPRRRDAWGNGRVEVVLARESLVEDKVATILVVDQRVVAEPRRRALRRIATCCMPVAPGRLRALGAGRLRATAPRVVEERLVARMEWLIGTTVLETFEDLPAGEAAREALVTLLLGGGLHRTAVLAARDEVEAFALRASMEHTEGEPLSFEDWLRRRVEAIGFESGEDLPLITEADLRPDLLEPAERERIDRDFPRSLTVGGLTLEVEYDLAEQRVILRARAPGGRPPRADFLPRWPGWSVAYHDGKHTVMLRG